MYKTFISHAVHDERGKSSGGKSGDQTGTEVLTQEWYCHESSPWLNVFRAKKKEAQEQIAKCAEDIVKANVGYDQSERTTLYNEANKVGFDIEKISVPVETDCSAMVSVCVNASGINIPKDMYTGNEYNVLMATGQFDVFAGKEYTRSSQKLKRGDILLKSGHTAIVTAQKYIISRQFEYNPDRIMRGSDVKQVQKKLKELNYFDRDCTGRYGKHTTAAIVRYQKDMGLIPDGIAGKKTLTSLGFYYQP